MSTPIANHRIGAVSALSGVPVSTLRVWETRHAAFAPAKSEGRHRLYSDDDVWRACLLKQLTETGHSISTLAALPAAQLNALLQQQRSAHQHKRTAPTAGTPVTLAVVGSGLAARLASSPLPITEVLEDLDTALHASMDSRPQVLIAHVNSLHASAGQSLQKLVQKHHFQQAIVLYNFGQEPVVAALKLAGVQVRREPLSSTDLGELVRTTVGMASAHEMHDAQRFGLVPPRKYSDEALRMVAKSASQLLCECPRHVAELITQLASFEQYSQECLHKSAADAQLHTYLSAVSGAARALFEQALERVAQHENIPLPPALPLTAPSA